MNEPCRHEDPDNSGKCIKCGYILDVIDETDREYNRTHPQHRPRAWVLERERDPTRGRSVNEPVSSLTDAQLHAELRRRERLATLDRCAHCGLVAPPLDNPMNPWIRKDWAVVVTGGQVFWMCSDSCQTAVLQDLA